MSELEPSAERLIEAMDCDAANYGPEAMLVAYSKSIAISLKRIADTLSGQGDSMLTTPINAFGEGIGEAISGQIVRGMRGDDR